MPITDMTGDLTVVFYTASVLHEPFAKYVRENLLSSIGDYPLISVSHKPMPWFGENICIGVQPPSHIGIYRAILRGAVAAKTPYVGLAEDDCFAPRSHWITHRPAPDAFAYDLNKWGINSWVQPATYGYRARPVINSMIAPTALLVETLEERFAKFKDAPDDEIPTRFFGEPGRFEKKLSCTPRKMEMFAAPEPSLIFSHEEAIGWLNQGARKGIGGARRTELPVWGTAQAMLDLWNA